LKVIRHPLYNNETGANDVLLAKLSSPAVYTARVSPVCLADSIDGFLGGFKCVTTGWGFNTVTAKELPSRLQQISLVLISSHECQKIWGKNILSSMICAGVAGASSCMYDTGGPLVCRNNGIWTLLGIVSGGSSTCSTSSPALYTSVPTVQTWVNQIIASD
ncbi:hypothetical protein FKM82_003523, partial [Ascaphus truei]